VFHILPWNNMQFERLGTPTFLKPVRPQWRGSWNSKARIWRGFSIVTDAVRRETSRCKEWSIQLASIATMEASILDI
jgi:hypothetical protein